jgi:hypothetical protein
MPIGEGERSVVDVGDFFYGSRRRCRAPTHIGWRYKKGPAVDLARRLTAIVLCLLFVRSERVRAQFLSLLQSGFLQIFSVEFWTAEKPRPRAVLRGRLGVRQPERYGKSLSERRSLSEAWGLPDLVYKLFLQPVHALSRTLLLESSHPVPLSQCPIAPLNRSYQPQAGIAQTTIVCLTYMTALDGKRTRPSPQLRWPPR